MNGSLSRSGTWGLGGVLPRASATLVCAFAVGCGPEPMEDVPLCRLEGNSCLSDFGLGGHSDDDEGDGKASAPSCGTGGECGQPTESPSGSGVGGAAQGSGGTPAGGAPTGGDEEASGGTAAGGALVASGGAASDPGPGVCELAYSHCVTEVIESCEAEDCRKPLEGCLVEYRSCAMHAFGCAHEVSSCFYTAETCYDVSGEIELCDAHYDFCVALALDCKELE